MVPSVPSALFGGIPGGPELLVILLIAVFMLGVPFVLLALGVIGGVRLLGGDDERVEELEARVAELERELERERARDGGDGDDRPRE